MIIKYPKIFTPPAGISPASIFIKGPIPWVDKLASELTSKYKRLTAIVSYDKFLKDWDIKHAESAEVVAINFRNIADDNIILLPITHMSRFPPLTYVYVDGRKADYEYWYLILERCNIKLEDNLEDISKKVEADFSYLNRVEALDNDTDGGRIKVRKRGRPKKT